MSYTVPRKSEPERVPSEAKISHREGFVTGSSRLPVERHSFMSSTRDKTTSLQSSIVHVVEEMEVPTEGSTVSRTKSEFMNAELKIGAVIGDGSFGNVHQAWYMGERVAVKVFRPNTSESVFSLRKSYEEDIQNEADVMLAKPNKHIVALRHHSKSRKLLVMELCANGSVFDFMRQEDSCPIVEDWSNRLKWMHEVALGMRALHEEPPSVLHRDLKLPNIFLDEKLDAKVGDFGLAVKVREISLPNNSHPPPDLAMTYQPPEVRRGRVYSTKSDVYSFGIMMHELLLLKGPYGFGLDAKHVDIRVNVLQENGKKPEIPEDRTTIPGEWNPCLEDYINLTIECIDDSPERRPEFRDIAQRLARIRKEYKKQRQMPHEDQTIRCALGVFAFLMVFPTFLFLLVECGRIIFLGKKDGDEINSRMKPDEYYFFEFLFCIATVAFTVICCWTVWIKRMTIWRFVVTCVECSRHDREYLISKENKRCERMQNAEPMSPKPSPFAAGSPSPGMLEMTPHTETSTVPSLLCPKLIVQNESPFYSASLLSALDPSSPQECLKVDEESVVSIDDDLT